MPHFTPSRTSATSSGSAAVAAAATDSSPPSGSQRLTWGLAVWAIVLAATMLSFYVHLLNAQVKRGERMNSAQQGVAAETLALRTAAR